VRWRNLTLLPIVLGSLDGGFRPARIVAQCTGERRRPGDVRASLIGWETTVRNRLIAFIVCAVGALMCWPPEAAAQGGPPYLTNDPGTPGNANWEINVASMQTVIRGEAEYQVPQLDINFGLGDRIQLTYEIPYDVDTSAQGPRRSGWSNALPGVKWRFFDQGDGGWQISTFPSIETGASTVARLKGIAGNGPRFLLPVEVAKRVGWLDLNFEAGYYFPWKGPQERIIGFVAGHTFTKRWELDGEVYNDWAMHSAPHNTTFDFGGRYKLRDGLILLMMAGRSFSGNSSGQPEYIGYFGIQVLLSKYGRTWTHDD
jgi:hypothetical protein